MQHDASLIPAPAHKTCNKCDESQDIDEFKANKTYSSGRDNTCRNAERRVRSAARVAEPVGHKTCLTCCELLPGLRFSRDGSAKDGLEANCRMCRGIKKKCTFYNITREEFFVLAAKGCALCGKQLSEITNYHIDHDHTCCSERARSCGICVRGAVCSDCNTLLIAGYERLPEELRTWPTLNSYLAERPIARSRLGAA